MQLPEYSGSNVDDVNRPAPDFDVRDYARTAVGSLREGMDVSEYETSPLSIDTLRTISLLQVVGTLAQEALLAAQRQQVLHPRTKDRKSVV